MDYVIIGNGVASIGAIEGIRRYDQDGSLLVVSNENEPTYGRPLISYFLAGKIGLDRISLRSDNFYAEKMVEQRLGREIVALDTQRKTLITERGEQLPYGKLLIATGGKPFFPDIPGSDGRGVYAFTTIAHAQTLFGLADKGKRAVIVGAGLIALKAAEGLANRGVHVTLVVRSRLMRVYFDAQAGELLGKHLESKGIHLMNGATPEAVLRNTDGSVSAVQTNKGTVPADFVVMAAGVRPRKELADQAGIECGLGIRVDEQMRTSAPDVFAAGDVAEAPDMLRGEPTVMPIWPNAYIQGNHAGKNMAGRTVPYAGGLPMNSITYFGLPTASVGLVDPKEEDGCELFMDLDHERMTYRKLVFRDDRLLGYVLMGNVSQAGLYTGFVRFRVPVGSDIKARLKGGEPSSLLWPEEFFDKRWNPDLEDPSEAYGDGL